MEEQDLNTHSLDETWSELDKPSENMNLSMPSNEDLLEAGFTEDAVNEILEDFPDKAQELLDAMNTADVAERNAIEILQEHGVTLQAYYTGDPIAKSEDHSEIDDEKLSSCDCRPECRYNTGHTWKSSNYGYAD